MNIYLFESDKNHCNSCYESDSIYTGFFVTSSPPNIIQDCLFKYYGELGNHKMYFSDFFKVIADQGYGDIIIGEVNDMQFNGKYIIDTREMKVSDVLESNFAAADENRRLKILDEDVKKSKDRYMMDVQSALCYMDAQYKKYPEVRSKYIKLSEIKDESFKSTSYGSSLHGVSHSLLKIIANYELLCRCGSGKSFMECGENNGQS